MPLPDSLEHPILNSLRSTKKSKKHSYVNSVIEDFWVASVSRELSVQGRREVLTGKAKFGVFGDGKELPQIAMARAFQKGDYRAGYYRDQTLLMCQGLLTVEAFFAQMYGDVRRDPFSKGRQMTGHFATPFIDQEGNWTSHQLQYNQSSGISCTAGQMGRAVGLAFASKKYRERTSNEGYEGFTHNGNEVCFCTIGDASTSEGVFFEAVNAAAVEQIPLVIAVWDDGYGISVPTEKQTTKGSISAALSGFRKEKDANGIGIYEVDAYNYVDLCVAFDHAAKKARKKHIPSLVHVKNCTQQLGHSTSGSHERYKTKERLQWESEYDCNKKMAEWMILNQIVTTGQIEDLRKEARAYVRDAKVRAWQDYQSTNDTERDRLLELMDGISDGADIKDHFRQEIESLVHPTKSELVQIARRMTFTLHASEIELPQVLTNYILEKREAFENDYGTELLASGHQSPLNVPVIHASYADDSSSENGYQIINRYFDSLMERRDDVFAFGEDVGKIGDVNQGMAGLQEKYGEHRVFDTGIREWTILGQGAGLAMRGLRAIAEIQYLDYLVYALPFLMDDVATARYRSAGQQQIPLIVRTRGHRLEGIWHTGSPMGMMIQSLRGIHICVPRNMVQAAGMYNTLLDGQDPGIVVECLNGYRLKEQVPANLSEIRVPLGIPEIVRNGHHLTLVTYGSCVRYALEAAEITAQFGITTEVIDVQTLLPFDLEHVIVASLRRTNRVLFVDEDVPGGASSYMMQQVLEGQGGYAYLDEAPMSLTAKAHRTPYGSDGDYYAKPQVDDIVEKIYELVYDNQLY